ncbi:amino acid permease [Bdellovibrionota bacterium FG-2]
MIAALFRKKSIQTLTADAASGFGDEGHAGSIKLAKELGALDLTALGVAAIIGAGIFSTIGNAAAAGGPAVVFLFIFTAIACGFSALCYAEFASRIPVAGSAYTYSYATFGELIAWIIGWDLLMEYAIGNIAVAISWSEYFTGLLAGYGIFIPKFLTMDYLSASRAAAKVAEVLAQGKTMVELQALPEMSATLAGFSAWMNAPVIGGVRVICNLPALLITVIITALVYVGIRESKRAANFMVALKVIVVLFVIAAGAFYVHPGNWSPFAPHGVGGVLKGVSGVFFAYIGFDAISTTAEECRNPQKDLPTGMIASLIICTVLYVAVALVLTGMVNYTKLGVGDPLAFVFGPEGANIPWISGVIAASAVVAMATVLLVFQLGQPRIWMAMSRDGLLPPIFSALHPKFRTPWFSTILTGVAVAVPSLFLNLTEVTDLTSIGTLFAFVLVCGGVLLLDRKEVNQKGRFRIPYYNGKTLVPLMLILSAVSVFVFAPEATQAFLSSDSLFLPKLPLLVFIVCAFVIAVLSCIIKLSLIPVLGLLSCGYLMTELGITNWIRFGAWLLVGLLCYFIYGHRHSKLAPRIVVLMIAGVSSGFFGGLLACEHCRESFGSVLKAEKSIMRLVSIVQVNEEFMAGLDPNDDSERIKARSNVSIAGKRIAALNSQVKTLRGEVDSPDCKKCFLGERKDG